MSLMKFASDKHSARYVDISAEKTESEAVVLVKSVFMGIIVWTDGTNDVTISCYNGADNSGSLLLPSSIVIPGSKNLVIIGLDPGFPAIDGIYVEASVGAGSFKYQVMYDRG